MSAQANSGHWQSVGKAGNPRHVGAIAKTEHKFAFKKKPFSFADNDSHEL
jgi:hypothetical protein